MRVLTPGNALILRVSQYLQGTRMLDGARGLQPHILDDLSAMRREILKMDRFEIAEFRRPGPAQRPEQGGTVPLPLFGRRSGNIRSSLVRRGVKTVEVAFPEFATHAARRTIEAQRATRNARGVTTILARNSTEAVCYARAHYLVDPKPLGSGPILRTLLPPGRYCFGLLDQNGFAIEEVVWPCPGVVTLDGGALSTR